jgi:hypothetical protein
VERKRYRHRQRLARASAHDRTSMYHDLPRHAALAAVEISDPYQEAGRIGPDGTVDVEARLEQFVHRDGSVAKGAPGWAPPAVPTIRVIQSLKGDPLARMHARRQIDNAAFMAGREYQRLHLEARAGRLCSVDLEKTPVQGMQISTGVTDRQLRAARQLAKVDLAVLQKHGGRRRACFAMCCASA